MNAAASPLEPIEQEVLDLLADGQLRRGALGVLDADIILSFKGAPPDGVRAAAAGLLRLGLVTESRSFWSATAAGLVASSSHARVRRLLMTWLAFFRGGIAAVGASDFQFYDWRAFQASLAQAGIEDENAYGHVVVALKAFDLLPGGTVAAVPGPHTRLAVPEDVVDIHEATTVDDLLARAGRRARAREEFLARGLEGAAQRAPAQPPGTVVNITHATIGAVAVGAGAVATGTVGVLPSLAGQLAPTLTGGAGGDGLGTQLRLRDLEALRAFWADFPTDHMDLFFESAAFRIVPESIVAFYYDQIQARARSSAFHLYDQATRESVAAFVAPFLRSIAKDEFFTEVSGGRLRFIGEGVWGGDPSEWAAELSAFKKSVCAAHEAYRALAELTRQRWPEIDLQETSRQARERRAAEERVASDIEDVCLDMVDATAGADALLRRARATIRGWVPGVDEQEVTLAIETSDDEAAAELLASRGEARITDGACTILVRRE